ncbi:MAG: hypothetical protein J7485_07740 [Sphingobium sp.]|nr:hypothetical protein [Sphingobium sp.]
MTQDQGRTSTDKTEDMGGQTHEDAGLAKAYQKAASGDAHHERKGGGPDIGGRDPQLTVTPEKPGVPMKDVAKPDEPVAGTTKNSGKWSDAELSGIESGETGEETREREPQRATAPQVSPVAKEDVEAKAARQPSRFTDAELSGLEPGETSME